MHRANLVLKHENLNYYIPLYSHITLLLPHGKKKINCSSFYFFSQQKESKSERQTQKIIPLTALAHPPRALWPPWLLGGQWQALSSGDFIQNLCHCFSVQRGFILHLYKCGKKRLFTIYPLQGVWTCLYIVIPPLLLSLPDNEINEKRQGGLHL